MKFLLLTGATILCTGVCAAQTPGIPTNPVSPVYSVYTCGDWISWRRSKTAAPAESWISGFVTGAILFSPTKPAFSDTETLYAYVDKWCAEHPLEKLAGAATVLVRDLYRVKENK